MHKPKVAAALAASAMLMLFAQPVSASEVKCVSGAPYRGAELSNPFDLSALPEGRAFSDKPMPDSLIDQLDEAFDRMFDSTAASAATISIWKPSIGYWTRTRGVTAPENKNFWWASTGKIVTATIILQLIDEGKLSSAAPVATFFSEFKHASTATVDDLLHHTSGIFTFNADLKLRERSGYKSPAELIAVADSHSLDFCPGTNWYYSNTNYVMLASIAEQIDGEPFADVVERRVAGPLGLTSLRVLREHDPESAMVQSASEDADGVPEIASIFGAGGFVANSTDMLSFLHAYLELGLVPKYARDDAVTSLYPMFGTTMSYGTGIMVTDVPDDDAPTTWVGHSGGSPQGKALLVYDTRRDAYLAIALNNEAPAEAIANGVLKLLD